jgi:hypothetical protein
VRAFRLAPPRIAKRRLAAAGLLTAALAVAAVLPAAANDGCGQCDFLITGRDGDTYTATHGNTVCVDESAIFTGTITLKGGAFEVCGAAIPSSVSFEPREGDPDGDAAGSIVNHGTLRYFSLDLEGVAVDNYGVLLAYEDLVVGPETHLVNHQGAFAGVGAELLNRGEVSNAGVVDASGSLRNFGRFDNGGLINAHRQLVNSGEFVNHGRINADEQFRNAEDSTFESHGGTMAAFDLLNEGLLFGDPSSGCNSLLVANRWRQPARGQLVGALDYCTAGRAGGPPAQLRSSTAKITSCSCFNP